MGFGAGSCDDDPEILNEKQTKSSALRPRSLSNSPRVRIYGVFICIFGPHKRPLLCLAHHFLQDTNIAVLASWFRRRAQKGVCSTSLM